MPLQNFYSTVEYGWNFSTIFGGGAIAAAINHGEIGGVAPRHVFAPEAVGAKYNTPSIAEAIKNTAVIQSILDSMPDTGGTIEIRDEFFTYGKISNPKRLYNGVYRYIPFAIKGTSPGRSSLINLKPGEEAIDIDVGTYAYMFPGGAPVVSLFDLVVVSQGPGIKIVASDGAGANNFKAINIDTIHCKGYGWKVVKMYGATLWGCRALYCEAEGFLFGDSTIPAGNVLWHPNLTAMWNQGTAIKAYGTSFEGGVLHCEGNEGKAVDFDACIGDLVIWQEGNHRQSNGLTLPGSINSRLLNCSENLIINPGKLQSDVGLGFECDDISYRSVSMFRMEDDPYRTKSLEGRSVTLGALASNISILTTCWQSGYAPTLSGTELTFPAGSFGHYAAGFESGAILTVYLNFTEINAESVAVGDRFELQVDIEPDQAFADWLNTNRVAIYSHLSQGPFGAGSFFPYYIRNKGPRRWTARLKATGSGTGSYYRFAFPNTTLTDVTQPTAPVKLKFNNLKFYHIKA